MAYHPTIYRAPKLLSIKHVNYTYTTLQYIVPNKY